MKNRLYVILAALCIGALAYAAKEQFPERTGSKFAKWFESGVYVGPLSPDPTRDTRNKVGSILGDFQSWDFPAITAQTTLLGQPCQYSGTFAKTGLRFGDVCYVGVDQALSDFARVDAIITASNAYKLRACSTGLTDAGTVDLADSGYTTTCIGNLAR